MFDDILGDALVDGLFRSLMNALKATIGFVYLYLRYWRPHRVREQLAQRYGGRYATAGSAVLTGLMQGLGVVLLLILAAVGLFFLGSAIWAAIGQQ
ncbi:hypothetical protein [Hymenobacter lapidiphilus]|uniref:Uncharacterized protein n=1 Tax=Hymenobacter lapidiphilus TaxID=2608003 RepID=A0A7Y7U441_9BACT|nr:hypothetical protein [Hymenobacter lapidiphilus]NVO30028.1 hypothetical protein [Hymenobacter lapidiphilus]